jgi:hypothetical protein
MQFKHTIIETITSPKPALEPFIIQNGAKASYFYAKQVLKKPWKEAEEVISEHPEYCYLYAKNVLKKRWDKAEKTLISLAEEGGATGFLWMNKALDVIPLYAKHVIKGRWKSAEHLIAESSGMGIYISLLTEDELKNFMNMLMANAIGENDCAKKFFAWKPTHYVKMEGSKAFDIMLDTEPVDRWGWSLEKYRGYHCGAGEMIFRRAFRLEEWLSQVSSSPKFCSIELCSKNDKWYWNRDSNHCWEKGELSKIENHVLKGTVTPYDISSKSKL